MYAPFLYAFCLIIGYEMLRGGLERAFFVRGFKTTHFFIYQILSLSLGLKSRKIYEYMQNICKNKSRIAAFIFVG